MRFLCAKCAKNAFAAGLGELTAGFKGPTSKGRGGEEREGERKGKEGGGSGKGKGRERKVAGVERGKKGKGSYRYYFFPTLSPDNDIQGTVC